MPDRGDAKALGPSESVPFVMVTAASMTSAAGRSRCKTRCGADRYEFSYEEHMG
jgi:hypothetical protein